MKKLISMATLLFVLIYPVMALADTDVPPAYLEQALSKLPAEKAEDFRDTMQQAHEDNKELYDQAHQLREDMHKILTDDTFDEDAFIAKSTELRGVHDKIVEKLDNAFAQATSELSVSERKKLAHAMEHTHKAKRAMKKADEQK